MAALETTVVSPNGDVYSLAGRIPAEVAKGEAKLFLEERVRFYSEALEHFDEWHTHTHRGSKEALTHEEWTASNG